MYGRVLNAFLKNVVYVGNTWSSDAPLVRLYHFKLHAQSVYLETPQFIKIYFCT